MNAERTETSNSLALKARTAAELMTENVVSIPETAPLHEAIATLIDRGFSGAPVVNAAGRPVGVISLTDIVVHEVRHPAAPARRSAAPSPGTGRRCPMTGTTSAPHESHRLEALVRYRVGWQVDDLHILLGERGLILRGHACTTLARVLAQVEAGRLSGLPVAANEIAVN